MEVMETAFQRKNIFYVRNPKAIYKMMFLINVNVAVTRYQIDIQKTIVFYILEANSISSEARDGLRNSNKRRPGGWSRGGESQGWRNGSRQVAEPITQGLSAIAKSGFHFE